MSGELFPHRHFSAQFVEEIQQEGYVGRALVLGRRFGHREHREVLAVGIEGEVQKGPDAPDLAVGPYAGFAGGRTSLP